MPYDVFISHNSKDKELVRPIAHWLMHRLGPDKVFFDERSIGLGQVIAAELETALDTSSSALVCFGSRGEGPWQEQEVWAMLTRAVEKSHRSEDREDFRLIPVLLPGADPDDIPWLLKTRLWADFREGDIGDDKNRKTSEALLTAIRGEKGKAGDALLNPSDNPYRGLSPFTEVMDKNGRGDHLFFCGRNKQCRNLAERLKRERLVLVSGASGNGKSSLARAGLRTQAAEEGCAGIGDWTRIHFFPGSNLLHALANALAQTPSFQRGGGTAALYGRFVRPAKWGEETIRAVSAQWAATLHEMLCEAFPNRETDRVLIILDQMEELFTHPNPAARDEKEQSQWTAAILTMIVRFVEMEDPRFFLVATLRADYRARCRISGAFWDFVMGADMGSPSRRHLPLDELDPDGWREAIKSPAERAGAYFEPGLISTILKDVYRQRGSMPLLQHALTELWKQPAGACLNHAAYENIGGVQSALQRTADLVLAELSETPTKQMLCQNLMLRLVMFGNGVPNTRRRAAREEFEFGPPYDDHLKAMLDKLVEKRLITADDSAFEVTHEALIRECKTVVEWAEEARRTANMMEHRSLTDAAATWVSERRQHQYLWPFERLAEFIPAL